MLWNETAFNSGVWRILGDRALSFCSTVLFWGDLKFDDKCCGAESFTKSNNG